MAQNTVVEGEYFWDIDPGQGNGTVVTATDGNFDEALEEMLINSSTLPSSGIHSLHIRVKGQDGTWSPVFSQVVNIQGTPTITGHLINLTTAEYFWDIDPGQGNGTALLAFDGNFDQALETAFTNAPATFPSNGVHTLNIRVLGQDGTWSPVFAQVINIQSTPQATGHQINITAGEYFWDTDPGQGNGTALLAFDGNFDEAVETAFVNAPATLPSNGLHTFHVRVLGQDGAWSPTFVQVMNVAATPQVTGHQINITAGEYFWDTDPGQGNGTALLAFDGNFDAAWEVVGDSLPTFSLSLGAHALYTRVQGQDGTWSPTFGVVVEIDTSLVPVISQVLGDSIFCSNSVPTNNTYSTSSQPNATYNWTVVGGSIVGGSGTSSITVSWDTMASMHEVRLQACNSFGCGNTFVKDILITSNPPITILTNTGRDSFCLGDSLTLTAGMGNYSYNWNTGATSSSIVVATSATYQLTLTEVSSGCVSVAQKAVTQNVVDTTVVQSGFTLTATANNAAVQWLDCGTNLPVAGATNTSFSPTVNGQYAAVVTQNGCQDTSSCYDITFVATTLLANQTLPSVRVYPNPNQGLFTIDFGNYPQQEATIELLNALGQVVYQTTRTGQLQTIEQTALPTGVYILRIDQQVSNRIIIE